MIFVPSCQYKSGQNSYKYTLERAWRDQTQASEYQFGDKLCLLSYNCASLSVVTTCYSAFLANGSSCNLTSNKEKALTHIIIYLTKYLP